MVSYPLPLGSMHILSGFFGNPYLNPPSRRVVLILEADADRYQFDFHTDDGSPKLSVVGRVSELQSGLEQFRSLAELCAGVRDLTRYRVGRFGASLRIHLYIGALSILASPPAEMKVRRELSLHKRPEEWYSMRCDFLLDEGEQVGIGSYRVFPILVPIDNAQRFGTTLLEVLDKSVDYD